MANNAYVPDPEVMGRRRFPDNKSFRAQLQQQASQVITTLQGLLPSNYPKDSSTNVGLHYRVLAREFSRLNLSVQAINTDKVYTNTRVQFLQQILGERLFLSDRIAPSGYNDETYRNYLIAIKNAYLEGSKVSDIEALASYFTGLDVRIKELYLEARDPGSSLSVVNTHMMVVEVFIDNLLRAGYNINQLEDDLDFFINLTRPAHVLYDTRLIWTEQFDVNKAFNEIFGDTGGGCIPLYETQDLPQTTVYAQQVFIQNTENNAFGKITALQPNDLVFSTDKNILVVVDPTINGTSIYDATGRRVTFTALQVGQYVRLNYQEIPGNFEFFWNPPDFGYATLSEIPLTDSTGNPAKTSDIVVRYDSTVLPNLILGVDPTIGQLRLNTADPFWTRAYGNLPLTNLPLVFDYYYDTTAATDTIRPNWYSQFYPSIYQKPGFQENVKKLMDYNGMFEPVGANYLITLPVDQLTDGSGNQAGVNDIEVTYAGTILGSDGTYGPVIGVDASTVQLNTSEAYWTFALGGLPLTSDPLEINYYYLLDGINYAGETDVPLGRLTAQIKTTPTTICDRWVQDAMQPMYEDMTTATLGSDQSGCYMSELQEHMWYPRLSWPYPKQAIFDPRYFGNGYFITLDMPEGAVLVDTTSTIGAQLDGTALSGSLLLADASSGVIQLTDSTAYWDSTQTFGRIPWPGDEFEFNYHYSYDGTVFGSTESTLFGTEYWQMPNHPLVGHDGTMATVSDVAVSIDGTTIPGAVEGIRPLLGHVILQQSGDFWRTSPLGRVPTIGDTFKFCYAWGEYYTYGMLFDDVERGLDSYVGYNSAYELVFDVADSTSPVIPAMPLEIGYRWRALLLHHSSVLNSPDTLNWNQYQKPALRASVKNQCQTLNHFNTVFSPEFLYDTSSNIVLNDQYLDNGLDPILKLPEGTPPFQATFSYQPGLVYQRKVQDIRKHHHPLIYSGMLMKEFPEGESVPLSTISDSDKVSFKIGMGNENLTAHDHIRECPPWILFDTLVTTDTRVDLQSDGTVVVDYSGVPDLRVPGRGLRGSLVLRDVEPSGTAVYTYTVVTTPASHADTTFQLPVSFPYNFGGFSVEFPAIPIMRDASTYASPSDVTVTLDGNPWPVVTLDATTGVITIAPIPEVSRTEALIQLTAIDIARGQIYLPGIPIVPENTTLTIVGGGAQYYGEDFYIYDNVLSWFGTNISDLFDPGDLIRVTYDVNPYVSATVVFTYRILSSTIVHMLDPNRSRIFDDGDIFPGRCPDGPEYKLVVRHNEYTTYLSDYSEGIKISYFNPGTATVEDHVFEGPVFEIYEAGQDQIGVPGSFPNALVRIKSPLRVDPPLRSSVSYDFLNDSLVRFRRKTIKELLPDRTFRDTQIMEMMPV